MTPEHTPWSSKNASSSRSHWKMCELAVPEDRAKGNPVRQTGARSSRRREAAESQTRPLSQRKKGAYRRAWLRVANAVGGRILTWLHLAGRRRPLGWQPWPIVRRLHGLSPQSSRKPLDIGRNSRGCKLRRHEARHVPKRKVSQLP